MMFRLVAAVILMSGQSPPTVPEVTIEHRSHQGRFRHAWVRGSYWERVGPSSYRRRDYVAFAEARIIGAPHTKTSFGIWLDPGKSQVPEWRVEILPDGSATIEFPDYTEGESPRATYTVRIPRQLLPPR